MPIMSEQRKVDDHRSDDDFERVATRGFVRLEIAGLELRLSREMARRETRLWWTVSATVGVFVVFGTVVQLLAG